MKNNMNNMLLRRRIMLGLASSPFSPEATAILKEDFPDEWNDIKAYGYDNREMVPYINEDPYTVVSLGLISGVFRWLIGDGNAYIDTGLRFSSSNTITLKIKYSGEKTSYFGLYDTSSNGRFMINVVANNVLAILINPSPNIVIDENFIDKIGQIEVIHNNNNLTVEYQGNIISQRTDIVSLNTTQNIILYNSDSYGIKNGYIAYIEFNNGTDYLLYPFVRNNEKGMIDIFSNTFYPNTNSVGAFTIEYTGRPYLNITSTTKTYIINTYGESAWNTVKEFFTNPDNEYLVKYVNEDPDIICSLVDIGYTRYIIGDDNAYIDTQYILNSNSKVYAKFKYPLNKSGIALGSRIAYQNNQFIIIQKGSGGNYYIGYGNETFDTAITDNNIHEVEFNKNIAKFDNISHTFTAQTFNTPGNAIIMGNNTNNTILACGIYISKVILDEKEFHPFVRNNVNGMIDILSNTFYPNTNSSGAFTISIEQNS